MAFEQGHALVIGVGRYAHLEGKNIPASKTDAKELTSVLCDPRLCGYQPEQVVVLYEEAASRDGILKALDALAERTCPESTVFLYYCGHGDFGSDGYYYLTAHDTKKLGGRIHTGTGVSELELLDRLRVIRAQRLIMLFNACYSGQISPHLGLEGETASQEATFGAVNLREAPSAHALLSTGEGRIIITASRKRQLSWVGSGDLTIFGQALVDGLSGTGIYPNNGFISAFDLYDHLYITVKDAAARLRHEQEPELTVLNAVGPFAVSLHKGATHLGVFDDKGPLPVNTAAREVDRECSTRAFEKAAIRISQEQNVKVEGSDLTHVNIVQKAR